jgi:hypothetical protein
MLGYTLLNSAMYFCATGVSGVHPHQITVPEALAPADGLVEFSFSLLPLHAAADITMVTVAINATAGRMILLIVFLSRDCGLNDHG